MRWVRYFAMAVVAFTSTLWTMARGDDAKINTPVVSSRLQGIWELQPEKQGGFQQRLHLGPALTGEWQRTKETLPMTIAWFVEGNELRILYYYEPDGAFNYRVKTVMAGYKLSADTLALTFDGKATTWVRVKLVDPAKP